MKRNTLWVCFLTAIMVNMGPFLDYQHIHLDVSRSSRPFPQGETRLFAKTEIHGSKSKLRKWKPFISDIRDMQYSAHLCLVCGTG